MVRRIRRPGYVGPFHVEAANSLAPLRVARSRNERAMRGSIVKAREIQDRFYEPADTPSPPVTRVDAANLIRTLQQLEVIAKRQAPRIACKANGRISFFNLAEIVAVHAEGNYVSLQHRPNPYLLRETLSSIAEKLKPYGFVRIHRSVIVNISAVEEIQPLPTGEYRLRIKGGKNYLVTRSYKDHLRDLAQLWVGSKSFPG